MEHSEPHPIGIRQRMRETIRGELTDAAVRLVQEVGFTGTTASAIASAAGVSERTFFRYFPTKEDAVLQPTESLGSSVAKAVAARPPRETSLQAFRAAFDVAVDSVMATPERWATVIALGQSEPALRRRHLQQQDVWAQALAAANDERMGLPTGTMESRLHSGVMMLAWERALVACAGDNDFSRVGAELDTAIGEIRRFVQTVVQ
ncbi:TetR family transcriptional regulator [Labedella populi]|uniref:TetR family transcriptional regulator n=1 Tax=Labedella populi TaxID=2498850 RepID=A0A444Q3S9_9MICO|nr:TetR family transcriptional regulator [Labedella populi]RWZ58503.1 TetR family transcriptional regulator [Labedella populi]